MLSRLTCAARASCFLKHIAKHSSMSTNAYPTERLGHRQIRLVQLTSPNAGEIGKGLLSMSTQVFNLDEAPPFKALSYTWDNPYNEIVSRGSKMIEFSDKPPAEIPESLSGHPHFSLRTNLYSAISTIQKQGIAEWLWVDSVCINQNDPIEKAIQVRLMKSIYSSASEVIVWLGLSDVDLDNFGRAVKDTLETFSLAFFKAIDDDKVELNTLHAKSYRAATFLNAVGIPDLPPRFCQFAMFCGLCRWFDRLWCIQEVILAKKVFVLMGDIAIPWGLMKEMTTLMTNYGWYGDVNESLNRILEPDTDRDWMAGLMRLQRLSKLVTSAPRPRDLTSPQAEIDSRVTRWQLCASILAEASQAQCADNRDRVYGLLGILDLVCDGQVSKCIDIDYSKTPEAIYLEVTREILKHSQSLDVICWKSNKSAEINSTLPSWVINYSGDTCSLTRFVDDGRYLNGAYDASHGLQDPPGEIDDHPPFEVKHNSLRCYGVKFDSIIQISTWKFPNVRHDSTSNDDYYRPLTDFLAMQLLELVFNHLPQPQSSSSSANVQSRNEKTRYEILWRTIILNHEAAPYVPGRPASSLYELWFIQYVIVDTVLSIHSQKLDVQKTEATIRRVVELLDGLVAGSQQSSSTVFFHRQVGGRNGVQQLIYLNLHLLRRCKSADEESTLILDMQNNISLFTKAMANLEPNSKLFVTGRGLLGLGPACANVGDEVWALRGGRVPFILRPISMQDGRKYKIAGGCFILDHMNGEMVSDRYGLKHEGQFVEII